MKDLNSYWDVLSLVTLTLCIVYGAWLLHRIHSDPTNTYDMRDLLLDSVTGKASLSKHIILFFALVSGWVIVWMTLKDKSVETLLLGVLAIFVTQAMVGGVTNMIGDKNANSNPAKKDEAQ